MSDKALGIFEGFLALAQEKLREPSRTVRGRLRLLHPQAPLEDRVSILEQTDQFRSLCDVIRTSLGGRGFGERAWHLSIGNWFRRSRLYYRVATEKSRLDIEGLLDQLRGELLRTDFTVTYLALIEYVNFHARRLDFGRYEIVRFSKEELDTLLQSEVRADFYPWAAAPTGDLARYWWIVVHAVNPATAIERDGTISVNFDRLNVISPSYSNLPLPIENVLRELALFDWRFDASDARWSPFGIPLWLRADEHLTGTPQGQHIDVSTLYTEPVFDERSGKEIGETPVFFLSFNEHEINAFTDVVRREGEELHRALGTSWSHALVDVASRFFVKAFVSSGMEELLWHITTIEALIGDREGSLIETLARRLSVALGRNDAERKKIRKTFKDLYDFRSGLVHGRSPERDVFTHHLFEARQFARNLLRWFCRFASDVERAVRMRGAGVETPGRREVLRLLDLEEGGIRKLRGLLPALPRSFPHHLE